MQFHGCGRRKSLDDSCRGVLSVATEVPLGKLADWRSGGCSTLSLVVGRFAVFSIFFSCTRLPAAFQVFWSQL